MEATLLEPMRSTTQVRVMTRHQYGISALVSQTSFRGKPVEASRNVRSFLSLLQTAREVSLKARFFPFQVVSGLSW